MKTKRVEEVWLEIIKKYKSEAACARVMGWKRQRLYKIVHGMQSPNVADINAIAKAIEKNASDVYLIFLREESTNGQQTA